MIGTDTDYRVVSHFEPLAILSTKVWFTLQIMSVLTLSAVRDKD